MVKDATQIRAELAKPFASEDLEWRLQQAFEDKGRGLAVPYVTNRAIQDRLDDVVGPDNWHNDFKPWHGSGKKDAQICGISIYFEGRGEWITKWDGAEDTDIEAIKGGLSDSMKRAAVQWGIGRVLYKMGVVWVNIEKRGRSWIIQDSERPRLDKAYMEMLNKLHLTPAQPGGLQSELTPKAVPAPQQPHTSAQPAPGAAPQKQPERKSQPQRGGQPPIEPSGGKITRLPVADGPAWEYRVLSANVQRGMNRQTMNLELAGPDGKHIRAFLREADPALVPGAELYNVTLSMKKQDSVIFYVLDKYEVLNGTRRAA